MKKKILIVMIGLILMGAQSIYAATVTESLIREDCTGYTGCYESLSAWASSRARDLVAADEIEEVRIEGAWTSPDTARPALFGWTTGTDNYIYIYTAAEARHNGTWDDTSYRLEPATTDSMRIYEDHVIIEGLQISNSVSNGLAVNIANQGTGSEIAVSRCIIKGSGVSKYGIYASDPDAVVRIWNNVIYDVSVSSGFGIRTASGSTGYIYNNTIHGTNYGMRGGAGLTLKNNIVQDSGGNSYFGTFNADSDYNISDDTSNTGGSNDITSASVSFADAAGGDFHLSLSDTTARDAGVDLSGDASLAFSDDIDGETRSGAWDIGADEIAGPPTNQPPDVDAGGDQNITLPANMVTLDGTVTDDGLPSGIVNTTWSHEGGTGAGTVTFGDAGAEDTTATFTADPGTYILRLTADDTDLTNFDEMTVTVNPEVPVNQPPDVDAGPDQSITLPVNMVTLDGTVTDDGLPGGVVNTTWSHEGGTGAGTVTFGDAGAVDTTATFTADAGTYILQLTADDTDLTNFDQMTVTVLDSGGGTGDITAVYAGPGLTGGAESGPATLSADTGYLQRRVSSSCTAGSSIRSINGNGTVVCETDDDSGGDITAVNAGTGLSGGATTGPATLNVQYGGTGSATTAAKSDHHHDSIYQQHYAGIAVVAKSGGDYTDPVTAMNARAAWCGTPSATNPCLLKIMPGVYNIGTGIVQMRMWIDIEGSGETVTKITGNINNSSSGVVNGEEDSEIRFLTVENTGGGTYSKAISNSSADSPKMTFVTAIASGASYNYSIFNSSGSHPLMTNVTASATGGSWSIAVYNLFNSSPTMTDVTATAYGGTNSIGVYNNSESNPKMTHVTATASGGAYNTGIENNDSLTVMKDVTASAFGSSANNTGVSNIFSLPTMMDVTASASGGASNTGIGNTMSSPKMINVMVTASGGVDNTGVSNFEGQAEMTNVRVDASGGSGTNYGVLTGGDGGTRINNAVINGWPAICTDGGVTYVGDSKIDGGVNDATRVGGFNKCAGVHDENYNFWTPPTCPINEDVPWACN